MLPLSGRFSLLASVAAGIGASICCVGPLLLLALGISGSWIANLSAMEPYRPLLIGMTLMFLYLSFRRLYLVPPICVPGTACAKPQVAKRRRVVFWIVTSLILGLLAIPMLAPLLY